MNRGYPNQPNGRSTGGRSARQQPLDDDELLARQLQAQELDDQDYQYLPDPRRTPYGDPYTNTYSSKLTAAASQYGNNPPTHSRSSAKSPSQHGPPTDESDIKNFAREALNSPCSGCGAVLMPGKTELGAVFSVYLQGAASKPPFAFPSSPILQCPKCRTTSCMGCGSQSQSTKTCDYACDESRIFVVWTLLCGFDHLGWKAVGAAEKRQRQTVSQTTFRGKGTGYGSGFNGFGSPFGGFIFSAMPPTRPNDMGAAMRASIESEIDSNCERIMRLLTEALPNFPKNKVNFDRAPPKVLEALLLRSSILDKAAELLRNDSIDDVIRRRSLYIALYNFIGALATHQSTASITVIERAVREGDLNLLQLSFDSNPAKGIIRGKVDTRPSLAKAVENIAMQSKTIVENAARNPKAFSGEEDQRMIQFCKSAMALGAKLKDNATRLGRPTETAPAYGKTEEAWHRERSVLDLPDNSIFTRFRFTDKAYAMGNKANIMPGRMKKLMLEVANMKTSLPSGIFVRHATSRLDCMKVLVVGPRDTPYENGLFEFDLICPSDYPNRSPTMFFRGAGLFRGQINPNLHADGKGTSTPTLAKLISHLSC